MTILVYTSEDTGHNLEYFGHIYQHICTRRPEDLFVFCGPSRVRALTKLLALPPLKNVLFDCFSEAEETAMKRSNVVARSFSICNSIRVRVRRYGVRFVYAQSLIHLLPAAPFTLPRRVQVVGIIYKIFLYGWHQASMRSKVLDGLKFTLLSRSRVIRKVFMLNDAASARILNRRYHTDKFSGLVDPYCPLPKARLGFRSRYQIGEDKRLFLHFGSLGMRKGTLEVIDSLALLNPEQQSRYAFVFAGDVEPDIRRQFKDKIEALVNHNITVIDHFLPYEELSDMLLAGDTILAPYNDTDRSSGLVAYASEYGIPIIAPCNGLVGKLVRRNHLGIVIPEVTPEELAKAYDQLDKCEKPSKSYCTSHSVAVFAEQISDSLR